MYLCLQILFIYMKSASIKSVLSLISVLILATGVATAEKRDSVSAGDYYIEGVRMFCAGQYQAAESCLTKCISLDPQNDAAMYYLAVINLNRNETDKAMSLLDRASVISPENTWYRLTMARLYANIGENDIAVSIYGSLIADHPSKSDYYYELIDLLLRAGRLDEALDNLDKIEQLRGVNELTCNARYEILARQNRYSEAEAVALRMDEDFPSARTALMLGDIYKSKYDDSTALHYYRRALDLDPDFIPAYFGIAEVYRMNRNFYYYFKNIDIFLSCPEMNPEMKATYINEVVFPSGMVPLFKPQVDTMITCTLEAHPTDTAILGMSGTYFIAVDSVDYGLELLRRNVSLHPDVKSAHSALLGQLYYLKDWGSLIQAASATVQAFPDDFTLKEVLAVAYWQHGDLQNAVKTYERILKEAPDDHPMLINCYGSLGDLYHELGNRRLSYSYYEKGLKINDNYSPILNNYAYYLSEEGRNLKKALEMSRKTVLNEPENSTYLDTYGWLLYLTGDYEQAKKYLKEAMVYGGKESAVILDHYAEALFALKEYNLAFLYWGNADKIDPEMGLDRKIAERRKEAGQK